MASLGIVVPAYRPDVTRLRSYVSALDERLAPARIVIELDAPREGCVDALSGCPATISVAASRRGKGAAIAAGFDRLVADGVVESGANLGGRDDRSENDGDGSDSGTSEDGSDGSARTDDGENGDENRDRGVLAFFDADASTPPESAAAVVAPVVAGETSVAVGSRRHPEASVSRHQTLGRRRLGDAFAWCARRTVEPSLYDYQCGAKALSATAWTDVRTHLDDQGFGWDLELVVLAVALGYEVQEIPITWRDRPGSTVPPVRTARTLARSLYRARRRAGELESRSRSNPDARSSGSRADRGGSEEGKRLEERNVGR